MLRFKSFMASSCFFLFLLMITSMAQAALTVIGTATYNGSEYNLIWEDENNGNSLIWLDYTNTKDAWAYQVDWATSLGDKLTINLYDGYTVTWEDDVWRLPTTVDGYIDPIEGVGYNGTTIHGYNITTSEMGYLFYEELGNTGKYDTNGALQDDYGLKNTGVFENLRATATYWSSTEHPQEPYSAWRFGVHDGYQRPLNNSVIREGLALRTGQVSFVPIPGTAMLLSAGILGLTVVGRKKR